MLYKYRWVPTGEDFACQCGGGRARGYRVEPGRSRKYVRNVFLCDNPKCEEKETFDGSRKGRFLLASH
jgi:hypothetical protein